MRHSSRYLRLRRRLAAAALLATALTACSDDSIQSPTAPDLRAGPPSRPPGFDAALAAQERHSAQLLAIPGVVGTGVGVGGDGSAVVTVLTASAAVAGIPTELDQVPVRREVTGRIFARTDPTTRSRPAPVGFSVGHPSITAGTIGARVKDAGGNVYLLSNNHVLAAINGNLGSATLQPGPYDGGTDPADRIGTLSAYEPLKLGLGGYGVTPPANWIDAAIALSSTSNLSNATAADGYGVPSPLIYGDGNGDGTIDDRGALLGVNAQKYGRTTGLTQGQIDGVNYTIDVCYDLFCFGMGRFYDQIRFCCSGFSDGGDSGSLIVSADGTRKPVALLFAGDGGHTFGNRIDLVLARFGVTIDGSAPPPPTPVTDLAVTSVSAPGSATQGTTVSVNVTVQNVGNQDVDGSIPVTLMDGGSTVGTQSIAGLAAGQSATRTFSWSTAGAALGTHTLTGSQGVADDDAGNDAASTVVSVNPPPSGNTMHVGDLDGQATAQARGWRAVVTVVVHDPSHGTVSGATVGGVFSAGGKGTASCTTGSTGSCTITKSKLRSGSVSFTVTGVTHATRTYESLDNHDPDGDSNGTSVTLQAP